MLRNQNPRGSACSGIQTEIPLWGVNIRRNVSRIKRLKTLSPSKIIPELGGQYAPEYPVIKSKISTGELILLDAVYQESQFVSKKAIINKLDYLANKDFLRENKVIIKTDELIPLSPVKFLNMLKNQFVANQFQLRKLTDAEFEVKKKEFMESADAKLIMYCQHLIKDNLEEEIYLVTEETSAANDLKLFKKIPAICDVLGIPVITLPELLEKYPEVDLGFK